MTDRIKFNPPRKVRCIRDASSAGHRRRASSDCPWYEGYTENPLGVRPTGSIHHGREEFLAYRGTA